ncbi:MAG: glycosyltransferase [Verrucomicrobiae bacterium]|nr:glycosyltransferase [Verrucomicrobiae bacterium]
MKLCDLTQFYSPDSGGVKRYLHEKMAHIERTGRCDHLMIVPGAVNGMTLQGRTRVYTIRSPRCSPTSRYRLMLNMRELRRILQREKPNLIELGDPYHVAWKAVGFARELHIPVVGFYHSNFPEAYVRTFMKYFGARAAHAAERYAERYVCRLYNQLSRTLVPSPELGALLTSWGVTNTEEVDLGVDTDTFHPDAGVRKTLCARHGIDPEKRILLYVTRLSKEKNVSTLLKAFALLSRQTSRLTLPAPPRTVEVGSHPSRPLRKEYLSIPNGYHLILIGDGPLRREVEECTRETGAVTALHYIAGKRELAEYYAGADLFVHPGVLETFGLAALESQSCGTPVCGIRGSRLDRVILAGHEFWAESNTPVSLAHAIERLSRMHLDEMGMQARKKVLEKFGWDTVFAHLFKIYDQARAL